MKPLTLRATLSWLGVGAVLYVVIIAAIIAVRITPTARALQTHSELVRSEYQAINERSAALHDIVDELQMWLYTEARPSSMQPAIDRLRHRIDSLSASATNAPGLSGIPTAMRVEFSQANVEQLRATTVLLEALANIELGRSREAERLLGRADSLANQNDRHQAAAQRLGLEDLVVREQSLAGAASASMRAVAWWLVLGLLFAPLLVVFVRRRFYAPLADLEEGIAQVADGDLGWTIPVRRADELGRLSEHFNEATAILCQRAEETRRHATTALRESEERYAAMFESAPIGIAIVDSTGRYAHTNPTLQRFLGYSEEELRGKSYRDVTLAEDVGESDRRFAGLIAGSFDRYSVEKRYRRKDGEIIWGRVSVAGVRDASGTLTHTVSMIEDVTDEKNLQAAAREADQRFRAVVSGAQIMLFGIDTDGIITVSEGKGLAALGQRPGEVVGQSIFDRLHDAPEFAQPFRVALAGQMFHSVATYKGTTIEAWVSPMRDPDGRVTGAIGVATDVTDRVRAEEARHKSEEKFSKAFRMNPNPSVIARLDDGLLVEVNDAYCTASGYTRDEVIGKSAREVLWAEPERRDDFVRQLREHGRVRDLEQKMKSKSGPLLDVLLSVEVVELEGVPHVLASAVDITNRKQAAEALRQSEEKFSKIFRSSPNTILITEEESGILVDANDTFFTVTGYSREEALGRPTRDLVWPRAAQRDALLAKLHAQGHVRGEEVELLTKSGRIRHTLISVERIELGGRRYLLSEGLDITDRKRASEALRESEQRFRRLVQDMSIGVALFDAAGRVVHSNPAAREILVLTEAEANDPTFWQTHMSGLQEDGMPYPQDERPVVKAVREGTPIRNVLVGRPARRGADVGWLLMNVDPQRDSDGTIRNFIVWFSDVTEQRKADEQLRLLGRAVQSTSELITITDRQGRFTYVNRAFLERYGYTEHEIIGQTVDRIVSPRNPPGIENEIRLETERGGWHGELYNRTKDGKDFVIALTTAQVKDSNGNVIGLMGVSSDITERKAAAQALRESEERYRSLVEASPDAISVVQDRRVVFGNPASFALIRGGADDFIGRPVLDFVTDEHAARALARLDAVLEGVKDNVEEIHLRAIDGRVITAETHGILIQYQGRPAVLVIHRDITARKEAERQLRLLAQAVKSTNEGISITDADGRFTFVNQAFAETSGYTEAELLRGTTALIDSPRNRPELQAEIRRATQYGTWSGELYNRRKDGTDFLISLTTAQVKDNDGRVIALMGVSSDITERKQLQDSVRRAETMAALGSVVAGVAHEVRNPLFGISATVDAFEARFGTDPGRERYTKTLRQEVSRLTKLMQDLLEYGKPPRLEITMSEVAPVVRRAIAASTALAESSGVWVREELPADLPPIPMDQSRIQQVFQNLIDNAIQHSPRGSTITLTGARGDESSMLDVMIADQGAGFREEDLARLFEPFFTRRRGGTGLGLSIVQRILEQHDGDIVARNGPSGGAVITVRLPLSRERRRRSQPVRVQA